MAYFKLSNKYLNDCGNLNHSYACGKCWIVHNKLNSWHRFSSLRTFLSLLWLLLLLLLLLLLSSGTMRSQYHNFKWIHLDNVKSHDPIPVCKCKKKIRCTTRIPLKWQIPVYTEIHLSHIFNLQKIVFATFFPLAFGLFIRFVCYLPVFVTRTFFHFGFLLRIVWSRRNFVPCSSFLLLFFSTITCLSWIVHCCWLLLNSLALVS